METVLGSGFMGDVAVDDIVVASGGCRIQPVEAAGGANYTSPVTPTLQPQGTTTPRVPGIYDCDFEGDFCQWTCDDSSVRKITHTTLCSLGAVELASCCCLTKISLFL